MRIEFTKMQGCGNDYIYIDCIEHEIDSPEKLSVALSDRHFGIGGDGIVLICKSDIADAKMRMFNIDGSEGKMCGNAIRCVAKYLFDHGLVNRKEMKIETLSGIKNLQMVTQNSFASYIKVDMGKAELNPFKIPVALQGESIINAPLNIHGRTYHITCVSMGNPHAVVFCDDVEGLKLTEIGPCFEHNEIFPEGVNTEFVNIISRNTIKVRVWERGSGETLACGTGACAATVAAILNGECNKGEDIRVILSGGELTVNYSDETVLLSGECAKVFEGIIEI